MDESTRHRVTQILSTAESGDPSVAEQLLPLVYDELRELARVRMDKEPPGQTLQPTALVHEAFMRLVVEEDVRWDSRGHFFAAAANAMRRILVERARRYRRQKHGAGRRRLVFDERTLSEPVSGIDVVGVDEALRKLERIDSRKAQVVTLRYFGGLTIDQAADVLGISRTTVKDEWQFARAWLFNELVSDGNSNP